MIIKLSIVRVKKEVDKEGIYVYACVHMYVYVCGVFERETERSREEGITDFREEKKEV